MDLQDINWTDGSDNTGGVQQNIYFARLADIETLPEPIVNDSTASGSFSQLVTINANIVMKAGKTFFKMYCTLETAGIKSDTQGELDGKSFKNELEFFHPGSQAEALGFAQWAKNSSLIFLVPELDGTVRLLGNNAYPAKMESSPFDTGKKTSDRKGGTFKFMSVRKGPAPIFSAQVRLTGGAAGSGTVDANGNAYQDIVFISGS